MKIKSINILLVSICLLGIMAVMLSVFLTKAHNDLRESITVSANGVTQKTLEINDLTLIPTQKKEYQISLSCEASGTYDLTLEYDEKLDGGMKDFVNVTVRCNGVDVYRGGLASLLDGENVTFDAYLTKNDPTVIAFTYEMPAEVGNEAKGTAADFNINLMIEKS